MWLRFEIQVSRRLLSTTNSKNWRHKSFCVRNKNGTFCGQGLARFAFHGTGATNRFAFHGVFCGQELFEFVTSQNKNSFWWSGSFRVVTTQNKNGFLWSASFKFVVINHQCVAKLGFMLKMFLLSPALIAGRCGYGSWGIGAHCSYIGGNREGFFVPASFQRPFFQKLFSYYYYF